MHCFHIIVPYAVLSNSAALLLEVHYRLNWTEKGVDVFRWMDKFVITEPDICRPIEKLPILRR